MIWAVLREWPYFTCSHSPPGRQMWESVHRWLLTCLCWRHPHMYLTHTHTYTGSTQILLIELHWRRRALTDVSVFLTTNGQVFKAILSSFVTVSFKGPPLFKGYNEMLFLPMITGGKNTLPALSSLTRSFSVVKLPNLCLRSKVVLVCMLGSCSLCPLQRNIQICSLTLGCHPQGH